MALTESIEYDKIEVVLPYNSLQIRKATVIKKDDVEISRTYHRYVLQCGSLDDSDNFVDNPLDKEADGVTAMLEERLGNYVPFFEIMRKELKVKSVLDSLDKESITVYSSNIIQ